MFRIILVLSTCLFIVNFPPLLIINQPDLLLPHQPVCYRHSLGFVVLACDSYLSFVMNLGEGEMH